MPDSEVTLTDVLVALSLATDLGNGQPAEHMLRSARISMRLGERLGLEGEDLATLYDVSILTYVGCPVYGNEAVMFTDDIEFRANEIDVDFAGAQATRYMLRHAAMGSSGLTRVRNSAKVLVGGGRALVERMVSHCSAVGELADRLALSPNVRAGLEQSYARWDGRGVPNTLRGEDLSLAARISHIAQACEVIHRRAGVDEALDLVEARSGTHFDPTIVAAVTSDPVALFDGIDEDTVDEILEAEPIERPPLSHEALDLVLAAIGDFCDLRCPWFAGHARGTAHLVEAAATQLQLASADVTLARRAALVHDVGRFGVPARVWQKPAPLSTTERERMRLHAYYVERIFNRPEPLRRIGLLAASHHERMDASGYHRGIGGPMLSMPARVLAVADAYHAMTQPRPHRAALTEEDAAREVRREVDEGRFDGAAADAVLASAGHKTSRTRAGGPAGLTARECDVLGLLAQGLPSKAIARQLGISAKTVGSHIERIYTKLGVSSRAAAAMRAMQHGIVGSCPASVDV